MTKNYINGQWRASGVVERNLNPSRPSDVIGRFAVADNSQVEEAIEAARKALPAWANATPMVRHDCLDGVARYLAANAETFGELLAREEGKIRADGIAEVRRAAQCFSYFAAETLRAPGELLPGLRPGFSVMASREPVGVVGIITPWNFPIAIPAWKMSAALAYGNTVVFKPAELTPAMAHALVSAVDHASLPPGVVNLVSGFGSEIGDSVVDGCDAITFTGSNRTGRAILRRCAEQMKKCQLELGGKNPLVIASDTNMEVAVNCALDSAFYQTGQRCTASSRLIVEAAVADEFVTKLTAKTDALKVGDALEEGTEIGPSASETQRGIVQNYIEIGKQEGAEIATAQGKRDLPNEGYFLEPTLFVNATNDMRICREEIFGPVAAVITADDFEHAVSIANDTEFGLSSGVCTTSLAKSEYFRKQSRSGLVMVNAPTAGLDFHVPFGGRHSSGFGGKEQGYAAIEFFTERKTTYVNSDVG